jgi:hypothetical protein
LVASLAGSVPRGVTFLSTLASVAVIAVLVLLSDPPGVIVAIIAVVVVGVVLRSLVPSSGWGRARWRRGEKRAVAHRTQAPTTEPIADQES